MLRKICLLLTTVVVLMSGTLFPALKDDIKITLEEKHVRELSQNGLILDFYISVTNSSSKTYYLTGYQYRFMVEQKEYIRLQTPMGEDLRIDPRGRTPIRLPVKITYRLLLNNIPELTPGKMVSCYMMGELAFSDGRRNKGGLPIAFTGEFPLFVPPEINLSEVKVNNLTVGGADLSLDVIYHNKNSFELPLDLIEYTIKFGGHAINTGRIRGDSSMTASGENTVSIPILLNFFAVGKEVHGLLQQDSLNAQITGEMELNTVWGRLSLPFDRKVKVSVKTSE